MKKTYLKKLVINSTKILISILVLFYIFFLTKEFIEHKIIMPYNYERTVK